MITVKLIQRAKGLLEDAEGCFVANDHTGYCTRMSELIHLLMDELVGSAPGKLEIKVSKGGG